MKRPIYLDHAAATPVDDVVLAAMVPYLQEQFYNPSALYLSSKQVKQDLQAARARVAKVLGARPNEIIFTAGGTEANNLAIHGVMQQYPDGNMLVSAIEHDSVLKIAEQYTQIIVPVDAKGQLVVAELEKRIDDHTVLVSIMHANNEIGSIQPIAATSEVLDKIRAKRKQADNQRPLLLHVDASQSANYLAIQPHKPEVDLMTLNGGKIYGLKQTGVLYVNSSVQLQPILQGGGQERGLRSGTENVAGAVAFATALEQTQSLRPQEVERLGVLQAQFVTSLTEAFPGATINSQNALVNFVHVTFPGQDNERLVMELDERGIQCAAGSACSASNDEPSHVLQALGLSEVVAQSSIRFTMGRATTKADIDRVVATLKEVILG